MSNVLSTQAQNYPEMIKVEGGTFQMADDQGIGVNTETLHSVTLNSFTIAKTETTVLQWKTFCLETSRQMPKAPPWGWIDSHPMVNVDWDDAIAYSDWLSDKTGKLYRLPTDAEWEYAARGGSLSKGYKYSGGQSMDMVGWFDQNSNSQTHPVAQKRANELGLYDMSGNVSEWCIAWFGPWHIEAHTNPKDAKTWWSRLPRGGSWCLPADYCRIGNRIGNLDDRGDDIGFRLVSK